MRRNAMLYHSRELLYMGELQDYLKQLFLRCALPPRGDSRIAFRQMCSLTLQAWVRLMHFLVHERGYPIHWISDVVDEILPGSLQGRFRVITSTLCPSQPPFSSLPVTCVSTFPFVMELQCVLVAEKLASQTLATPHAPSPEPQGTGLGYHRFAPIVSVRAFGKEQQC